MGEVRKLHGIMIPIPHPGHLNPSIDLALKLASNGFAISFVNLEFVHRSMISKPHQNHDLFSVARSSGLDIHEATIEDGFPPDFDRVLHLEDFWESMLIHFAPRVHQLVGKLIQSHTDHLHFLIADTLYTWPATIARNYNLVSVSFWTEPALVFSLIYHSQLLRQNNHFPCKDEIEDEINYVPGIKSINTKDFMPYLKESQVQTTPFKLVHSSFEGVKKVDFILHNTVYGLESETLTALNKYQRNYAIGPVSFSKGVPEETVRKNLTPEWDCTEWLGSKPPGSVLYVSFGSVVQMRKQVIEEIAYGLLLSDVSFIWVVRSGIAGSDDGDVLPDGFVDEIKDRGMIIPWCNQMKVLSDPTVGGFLTDCGWNSILESIWCGVPMICYPVDYDQPTNRKLVVDEWKIGVSLCDGKCVDRKEVAEKIRRVIVGGLGREIVKVREEMKNAVEIDGSSEKNFQQFVKDLEARIHSTSTSEPSI